MTQEEQYMAQALALAEEAAATGDIPVGCVVVKDGVIIGQGRNRREETGDATAHAEVEAIRHACAALGSWAAGGVRSVRDPGAMPHVRWGYDQRPDSPGLVRRAESQGRLLRWGAGPVSGAVQPPPPGLRRGAGGGVRRSAASVFSDALSQGRCGAVA